MVETNVAVSDAAFRQLREMAEWAGLSVGATLERAIKEQYDRKFWEAVNAGYAAMRGDPLAWAEMEAERRSMDGCLMDGLDPEERWGDNGDVRRLDDQERAS
jgi:Ribbon-helix-helix protein, copG family